MLNSSPVVAGDLIYLYNTAPIDEHIAYFEDSVSISKIKYNKKDETLVISLTKDIPKIDNTYYIVILDTSKGSTYYFKVVSISNSGILVKNIASVPQFKNYSNLRVGIAKSNLRGNNNSDIGSLFNKTGYNVISVGNTADTQWNIEIDFPYNNLKNLKYLNAGDIFFIQEKMQISYTFTVTIKTKDYQHLQSELNESGNN